MELLEQWYKFIRENEFLAFLISKRVFTNRGRLKDQVACLPTLEIFKVLQNQNMHAAETTI